MIPAPFSYFGGKARLVKWIISHFPVGNVCTFVDLFGGSGVITLNAPHCYGVNVYNEIDYGLYCLFDQIKNNSQFQQELWWLHKTCKTTVGKPRTDFQKIWDFAKHSTFTDPASLAIRTFVKYRLSVSGAGKSLAKCRRLRRGMNELESKWFSSIDNIPIIRERLKYVTCKLENLDFRDAIQKYDSPTTFFYADPPYWGENRTTKKVYSHEFTELDHRDLASLNRSMQGKFLLSGYHSKLYDDNLLYGRFAHFEKQTKTHASFRSKKTGRVEVLWMNY